MVQGVSRERATGVEPATLCLARRRMGKFAAAKIVARKGFRVSPLTSSGESSTFALLRTAPCYGTLVAGFCGNAARCRDRFSVGGARRCGSGLPRPPGRRARARGRRARSYRAPERALLVKDK